MHDFCFELFFATGFHTLSEAVWQLKAAKRRKRTRTLRVGAERRVPLARHLPPDHRREPREAPRDARAQPRAPAVALYGVYDAQRFLNRQPRARAVVVQNVERVLLRGVVEHDDRVDVAPLAFVRYARDAEPTPEPGVHGRAR